MLELNKSQMTKEKWEITAKKKKKKKLFVTDIILRHQLEAQDK